MSAVLLCQATALHLPLRDASVHVCVTSPPYWGLRDYGITGQLGLEITIAEYVETLVQVFREVKRVLRDDGTLWLNIGDTYAGSWGAQSRPNGTNNGSTLQGGSMLSARQIVAHPHGTQTGSLKRTPGLKPKDLCTLPARVALALQQDGWYLRSAMTWCKTAPMPESVQDRPTSATEMVFLLTKQPHYYYDAEAVRVPYLERAGGQVIGRGIHGSSQARGHDLSNVGGYPQTQTGRNLWNYWVLSPEPTPFAHFATMPTALVRICLRAGCPPGGMVFDPFCGSGTTLLVARKLGHHAIGVDLSLTYLRDIARARLGLTALEAWAHGQGPRHEGFDDLPLFAP